MFGWAIQEDQVILEIIPGMYSILHIFNFKYENIPVILANKFYIDSIQTQMKNSGILILELQLWEI